MSVNAKTVKTYGNKMASKSTEKLYLDAKTADANFIFEEDSIPAHKSLMAASSDVFDAMFYGELKEKRDVQIVGVTIDGFKKFLQFFYLNDVELNIENIADVMSLGHKYNVTDCFDTCVQFLKDTLSGDNACLGYGLAIFYEQDELIELCKNKIAMNTEAVFKSNHFLEAHRRTLAGILDIDILSRSEVDVFEAYMAWVKAASIPNELTKEIVQAKLGDLFYNIRFASMSIEAFCTLNRTYDHLFTLDEFKDITRLIVLPDYTSKVFNNNRRQVQWNREDSVKCNHITSEEINYKYGGFKMGNVEKTTFSTTKSVQLGQFTCAKLFETRENKICELKSKIPVEITIVEAPDSTSMELSRTLSKFNASLEFKLETVVPLPTLVLARPGYTYEIRVEQASKDNAFKYQFLERYVEINSDTKIIFHNHTIYGGGAVGLITALEFKL